MSESNSDRRYRKPVIRDLGRQPRKKIRRLKNREPGELMDEVQDVVDEVIRQFGTAAEGKEFVPVVLIYREKRRRGSGGGGGGFPFPLPLPLPFKF